ncbi:Aste57867_12732 [Aphanomyces stellatus]|uniref:Aste57867_12732 protein n=1 Tax=Aphanomyces stellatus TaxID=120398 RepID=A0A485KXQ7_9STRA|nr:hypothetical protein As57867_012684 [Aphanomyces stellatus]VFT89582.1 Aste57867_12732 [Aphanomyces stellatus]
MLRRVCLTSPLLRLPKAKATIALSSHGRFFSSTEEPQEKQSVKELIYEAPLANPVRMMKGVSITSCTLTSIGMPVMCYYGQVTSSLVAQWAMCGTVMFFGMGTTALFHVLFKPYVLRLWIDRRNDDVTVETLNLVAAKTTTDFNLSDATRPDESMHPMINFKAKGKHYFIQPEGFNVEDKDVVERLLGRPLDELVPKVDDDDANTKDE